MAYNTSDDKYKASDMAYMFAAGAYSAVAGSGMNDDDAREFVSGVCKQAAFRRYVDDDDEETWWGRNKGWALPLGVGIGAFILGKSVGKSGRPDRGDLHNSGSIIWKKIKDMLGTPTDPLYDSVTKVDKEWK